MRATGTAFLFVVAILTGCCTNKQGHVTPARVTVPPAAVGANVVPVNQGVHRVQASVDRTAAAVRSLEGKLRIAQITAEQARAGSEEAFQEGLEAGGAQAALLRDQVSRVADDLHATKLEREEMEEELEKTKEELDGVEDELDTVQKDLGAMEMERAALRTGIEDANQRIDVAAAQMVELQDDIARAKAMLEGRTKWMWRWFIAFGVLAAINVVYVVGRLNSWSWIR